MRGSMAQRSVVPGATDTGAFRRGRLDALSNDWDRQIENLDVKETEIHQEQLRLLMSALKDLRGQLCSLQRDVEAVKRDCGEASGQMDQLHKHAQNHATLATRVKYLEDSVGDSADKHQIALDELSRNHDSHRKEIAALKAAQQDGVSRDRNGQLVEMHANVQERLRFLEKTIGDNADKHGKALKDLEANHAKLAGIGQEKEMAHASLEERIGFVEQQLGDSADAHREALKGAHGRADNLEKVLNELRGDHTDHVSNVQDLLKDLRGDHTDHVNIVQGHMSTIMSQMDLQKRALGELKDKFDGHVKVLPAKHASIEERLGNVERFLSSFGTLATGR